MLQYQRNATKNKLVKLRQDNYKEKEIRINL